MNKNIQRKNIRLAVRSLKLSAMARRQSIKWRFDGDNYDCSGKLLAFQPCNVTLDMVVLGKSLSGGVFPLAALITRGTLEVIVEENLPERARVLGEYAQEKMRAMQERHPLIADVRGLGLLLDIELAVTDAGGQRRPAFAKAEQVMYEALKRGLNFKVTMGNVLTLTPALVITQAELDQALNILDEVIGKVEAK